MEQHAILYRNDGAGDRGRTGTVSLPPDFESGTSANSITPANKMSCGSLRKTSKWWSIGESNP